MFSLSIYSSTASTAQHSAISPAQSSTPSTCLSEYMSKEVCIYLHAASELFSWSMELLAMQVALRTNAPTGRVERN